MGDNFSKQGELDLNFCCPSHSAELGGEGRYVLVFSAGWLQSPVESTALPLSLFCLLSVQCRVPRGDAMVWRWCPSLCTDLGGVLVCSAERRERQTTRQHPRLDPGHDQEPASLGAPPLCLPRPHALDANYNLLRGSLPSQGYFTFAHPSLDIHLRNRGQY